MIGTLDVEINAANPSLPLPPFKAFVNSPSSIRVRNVPRKVGKWEVTKVFLAVNYPDNSIKTAECVLTGGVWVGTIAGSTLVGRSANGYQITANGTDENGAAVSGYCLAIGDVEILTRDGTITIGETTYYVHICDTQPTSPKKGDLCKIAGTWKIYNGTAWDTLGGGGGGNITDVKVNGVSVVDSEGVALIDISGKADATALTAEVNRATAAEATKASAASLTAETNRATAAEALKRDKTDMTIPAGYDVTIPAGSQKTDKSKYTYEWYDEEEPTGYIVYYDGSRLGFGIAYDQHDDFTVEAEGLTYSFTWVATDTIAKTSEVNAGLATKVQKPTSETSADNGKYLQKTANGNVWATVQSGPSIVTSFPATPLDTNVPSTKLVKDSLDAKFDKAGGTISGNVTINNDESETHRLNIGDNTYLSEDDDGEGRLDVTNVYCNEIKVDHWDGEQSTYLTIKHTGSTDETLTQRIVRDANVDAKISADKTHAVSISATGVNPISPTAATGNVDVSTLFSGDNTSLTDTIDEEIEEKATAPDAHLEVNSGVLSVIDEDDATVWQSGYKIGAVQTKTESGVTTYTLADRTINTMTLSASATPLTLPTIATTDTFAKDFLLDVTNGYTVESVATAATISFTAFTAETINIVTDNGDDLSSMTSLDGGEHAIFTFTETAPFGNKPTYLVAKKVLKTATGGNA